MCADGGCFQWSAANNCPLVRSYSTLLASSDLSECVREIVSVSLVLLDAERAAAGASDPLAAAADAAVSDEPLWSLGCRPHSRRK